MWRGRGCLCKLYAFFAEVTVKAQTKLQEVEMVGTSLHLEVISQLLGYAPADPPGVEFAMAFGYYQTLDKLDRRIHL
jgi:hypothetical protein